MTEQSRKDLGLPDRAEARLAIALDISSQLEGLQSVTGETSDPQSWLGAITQRANAAYGSRIDYHWWNSDRHGVSLRDFSETMPIRIPMEHLVLAEALAALEQTLDKLVADS